ncbi:geranylgeranylglycerol-phosphate geranylgeranyltransferase [Chitinophaga sp.]|uniref:geranylgeranylglycerol-phosphate geranylgeranyltransferase n=1 Tax=Chitinophaga sp. TaxID=1869181 RepID=UPI002F933C88
MFGKLIRWPNLVFILLTQSLLQYCVLMPGFVQSDHHRPLSLPCFLLIVFSYVALAAAGYIINDYFDLQIDQVNKPERVFISLNGISKQQALVSYWALNLLAIAASIYVDIKTNARMAGISAAICAGLLYYYSLSLKKRLLLGNILVAAITAWSIMVLICLQGIQWPFFSDNFHLERMTQCTFLYTLFAFIISLVREIVKDMEDVPGDIQYGCYSMPIAWGIPAARVFAIGCLTVLLMMLLITGIHLGASLSWVFRLYCGVFILLPLLHISHQLLKADTTADFRRLSQQIKGVMLTGILSMVFFLF